MKWSETPVGPDGPWNSLNVSWDANPSQVFAMLPSLTKNSLIVAADACSRQDSACPNQVQSGDWPMWTSSAAHAAFLYMDGPLFDSKSWDETVSAPLNVSGDVQWAHERAIVWSTNNDSNSLNDQAITLTHNLTSNYPGGQAYTMNAGFFSLNGAGNNMTWLNTTGVNNTQGLQLATAKSNSLIKSLSYGLQVGSPSLNVDPSLVLGGYDRSLCLTKPVTTQNSTFHLTNVSIGSEGSVWPFPVSFGDERADGMSFSSNGLMVNTAGIQVLPNPGVPYMYLPQAICDAIARYLPVAYSDALGLYLWNTDNDTQLHEEITTSYAYLTFTLRDEPSQTEQDINVPFALLDLELNSPLTSSKTRYFPCRPFVPQAGQPYHLGRAFLQAALLVQNWETNTTWLSQAPGPNMTIPSRPVIIEEDDTTIAEMPNAPVWLTTWNGTLRELNQSQTGQSSGVDGSQGYSSSEDSSLSGGAIAGISIGAVAGLALIAAAIFFYIRRRRSKAGYGDVALISFDEEDNARHQKSDYEPKPAVEPMSSPIYEVESTHTDKIGELPSDDQKKYHLGELSSDVKKQDPTEVDGTGIAELPGHDVHR
ncbi:hypothetical protein M436DRAFT_82641 [Aureobasidium namibiae CBS 147.97]|uniref:Acid protease n=1 Tax=Aureobasidium namibiae CBS 147.97 TaxID=1043004 RepID=A0A074WHM5_9PEZI|nr:uncharacterized protein M436DRAFT_82641 [Aureobasidium namibiae CBS 147.97]KEQ72538.1 hypothetical protein M436DRAFT_82641 [Aureobasidium namibiae CBS 147.97]